MIRINVNPNPKVENYDRCVPYAPMGKSTELSNSQTTIVAKNTAEMFADTIAKIIGDKTSKVCLVNNGEPLPRMDAARLAIQKYLPDVTVICRPSKNTLYKNKDLVFDGKQYRVLENAIDKKLCHDLVDSYLDNFSSMKFNSKQSGDGHLGYFRYGAGLRFQYGKGMPRPVGHGQTLLYAKFQEIWKQSMFFFKKFFRNHGIKITDLEQKLILRLVHNMENNQGNVDAISKHIDNSLITGWITQRPTGAKIFTYKSKYRTEKDTSPLDIECLFDKHNNGILIIPGTSWCEQLYCNTAATWHEVSHDKNFKGHRIGLVVMIRDYELERTKK